VRPAAETPRHAPVAAASGATRHWSCSRMAGRSCNSWPWWPLMPYIGRGW